jgi:hypothetical protein
MLGIDIRRIFCCYFYWQSISIVCCGFARFLELPRLPFSICLMLILFCLLLRFQLFYFPFLILPLLRFFLLLLRLL